MYAKLIEGKLCSDFISITETCRNGKMPYLNCYTGYYPWDK